MPKSKSSSGAPVTPGTDVDMFLAQLAHPLRDEFIALRDVILSADKHIAEGIKWNVPSFRTTEWFATMHLRAKAGFGVILHFGAKKNAISESGVEIPDPAGLLDWLARDRAAVVFRDMDDLVARRAAFVTLLGHWLQRL